MPKKIIIGSRGSDLALWQANFVLAQLKKIKIAAEINIIKTQGDIVQNLSWDKMEGKGFFTKEIEDALLRKEIDLAVHSHKDLPTDPVNGLVIAAVSEREDPSELLLIRKNAVDAEQKFFLKQKAVVGTSSARRKSQLLAWRPDVRPEDLRGNVPTRIQKLRDKKYDAILIANAGVSRLQIDLREFHCELLDPKEFIPAPAQGVLALQIRHPSPSLPKGERAQDEALFSALQKLNSKEVQETISIERKILNLFDGGCQLPLGVYCEKEKGIFKVRVAKAEKWDSVPRYFHFESKSVKGFAEKIVKKMVLAVQAPSPLGEGRGEVAVCPPLEGVGGGRVFISRNEKKNDFLKRTLEAHGYNVHCEALIDITPVDLKSFPKTDWVFFSSKNAVKHFVPPIRGVKAGTMGTATAEEARRLGWQIDFVGDSNNTEQSARKFAQLVGRKTVLFPQAKDSLRTVQRQLRKAQVNDVIVYETVKSRESGVGSLEFDILVFTSPSNVEAFFGTEGGPPPLRGGVGGEVAVIAMGDATASALKKYKVKVTKQPVSFDDIGLVQAVFGI